jgi:hypothetical protein
LKKRNTPPQFYLNKSGPLHISDVYMWFNQGLVTKVTPIAFTHPQYGAKTNVACFQFEKCLMKHCNDLFDNSKVPLDVYGTPVTFEPKPVEKVAEAPQQKPVMLMDPAISLVHQDPSITMISGGQTQPIDPAIVSFK